MAAHMFAAINVGSFELELGIYEISNKNRVRRIDHVRHVIELGRDIFRSGKISYAVADELCRMLEDFVRIIHGYGLTECRAYATSVMREAMNNHLVLEQIRVRTGLKLRVVSNAEHRFLNYKAIAALDEDFDRNIKKGTAIVDVGFGSMQISLFDKNLLISTENLPIGVLRISNSIRNANPTVDRTRDLVGEIVESELENYRKMYLKNWEVRHLIGIGEPILYLFRYENDGKPLTNVTRSQFEDLYARLSVMNEEEIESKFGVSADYARLILPGAVIYQKVMEMTGAEQIWVPGVCFCDGIAAEYAADKKLLKFKHSFENDIISTSRNMAKRYRCRSVHSEQVEEHALEIFDAMKKYHGMGKRERLLLQIAAIIHACGKFVSVHNANECSYNIIMSTEIIGISQLEQEIIANVVRYNLRDFDYDMIRIENDFHTAAGRSESRREAVILIAKLTAILRLANTMDRGHKQKLKGCRIAVKNDRLVITTDYSGDITLEAVSFENKAEFFEEIFGIRPVLKQKRGV